MTDTQNKALYVKEQCMAADNGAGGSGGGGSGGNGGSGIVIIRNTRS